MDGIMGIVVVIGGITLFITALAAIVVSFYVKVDQGQALIINGMAKKARVSFSGGVVYPIVNRKEFMNIAATEHTKISDVIAVYFEKLYMMLNKEQKKDLIERFKRIEKRAQRSEKRAKRTKKWCRRYTDQAWRIAKKLIIWYNNIYSY